MGSLTSSTKVNFSSPKVCSYTSPAYPSTSGVKSSTEFWAIPPQLSCSLNRAGERQSLVKVQTPDKSKVNSPLHISPLSPPQCHDPLLRQHIQTQRINSLLINNDKRLPVLLSSNHISNIVELRIAHLLLEFDNFHHFRIGEFTFRLDQFLSLFGGGVEESRVDFTVDVEPNTSELGHYEEERIISQGGNSRLLVLQRHVQSQNKAIFQPLGHIRMSRSMIQHQTPHQSCIDIRQMLHLHQFNHV